MALPYSRGRHGKFALTVTGPSHVPYLDTYLEVLILPTAVLGNAVSAIVEGSGVLAFTATSCSIQL